MILLLDPSLSACGWAIISLYPIKQLIAGGCICTKPLKCKITESDTSRITYICEELNKIIDEYKCKIVIYEEIVGSKSSRANQALSFLKGAIISLCVAKKLFSYPVRAKDIKKSLTGSAEASKNDILNKLKLHFTNIDEITEGFPDYKLYGFSDALATFFTFTSMKDKFLYKSPGANSITYTIMHCYKGDNDSIITDYWDIHLCTDARNSYIKSPTDKFILSDERIKEIQDYIEKLNSSEETILYLENITTL